MWRLQRKINLKKERCRKAGCAFAPFAKQEEYHLVEWLSTIITNICPHWLRKLCWQELMYKGGCCLHCFRSVPCCSTLEYPYIYMLLCLWQLLVRRCVLFSRCCLFIYMLYLLLKMVQAALILCRVGNQRCASCVNWRATMAEPVLSLI